MAPTRRRGESAAGGEGAADGTKEFVLTAEIIDWEVEPGKTVEGRAYNGQVPGPWIRV